MEVFEWHAGVSIEWGQCLPRCSHPRRLGSGDQLSDRIGDVVLSKIRLDGFKAYSAPVEIELKPMTVFCGTNGCGKSTILQALMALKQCFVGPHSPKVIRLNGDYVHLGGPHEVIAGRDLDRTASLGCSFHVEDMPWIELEHRFVRNALLGVLGAVDYPDEDSAWEDALDLNFDIEFFAEQRSIGMQAEFRRITVELRIGDRRAFLAEITNRERVSEDQRFCKIRVEAPGFPGQPGIDEYEAFVSIYGLEIERVNEPDQDGATYLKDLPMFPRYEREGRAKAVEFIIGLLSAVQIGLDQSIQYVGPLRVLPAREYPLRSDAVEVGPAGENAVQVFADEAERALFEIRELGESDVVDQEVWSLTDAMRYWFEVMGLGTIEPFGTEYSSSLLLNSGRNDLTNLSLVDTGFGYSQVFPILLQGLRLPMAGTLALEQPEIHLHPRMQMQIADFLLAMADAERSIIVETHSDHVVNRVVRRVVEGAIPVESVAIYFVEPGPNGPSIRRVDIDPLFGIRDWPLGFFDQFSAETEAIMRAGLRRRAAEGQN